MDNDALLTAIRDGDRNLFGEIIDVYEFPLARYFFRLTGDAAIAEKLTGDTLVSVGADILQGSSSNLPELIYKTATNRRKETLPRPPFYKRLLKHKCKTQLKYFSPAVLYDKKDMQRSLLSLPPEYRVPVVLHFVEGIGYQSVANITGATKNEIAARIFETRSVFLGGPAPADPVCVELAPLLSAYADRELEPGRSRVESHTRLCAQCQMRLGEYIRFSKKVRHDLDYTDKS